MNGHGQPPDQFFNLDSIKTDLMEQSSPETQEALRALARLIARRLTQDSLADKPDEAQTITPVS